MRSAPLIVPFIVPFIVLVAVTMHVAIALASALAEPVRPALPDPATAALLADPSPDQARAWLDARGATRMPSEAARALMDDPSEVNARAYLAASRARHERLQATVRGMAATAAAAHGRITP